MGLPTPWFWTSRSQNCERIFPLSEAWFCAWQPRGTKAGAALAGAVSQKRRRCLGFTLSRSKDLKVQWKIVVFLGGHIPHFSLLKAFYDASQCFNIHKHSHMIRVCLEPKRKHVHLSQPRGTMPAKAVPPLFLPYSSSRLLLCTCLSFLLLWLQLSKLGLRSPLAEEHEENWGKSS